MNGALIQPATPRPRILVGSVVFSALLHLALLWPGSPVNIAPPVLARTQTGQSMQVHISAPTVQQTDSVTADNEIHKPSAKEKSVSTPVSNPVNSQFRERILVNVQQAIATRFTYPLLARQRNWQGEVLLAFRLELDGRISEARIARSSGYGILDQAALTALNNIKRISQTPAQSLTIQVPVLYRLES